MCSEAKRDGCRTIRNAGLLPRLAIVEAACMVAVTHYGQSAVCIAHTPHSCMARIPHSDIYTFIHVMPYSQGEIEVNPAPSVKQFFSLDSSRQWSQGSFSVGGVKINVEHFEIFKMAAKMAARPKLA